MIEEVREITGSLTFPDTDETKLIYEAVSQHHNQTLTWKSDDARLRVDGEQTEMVVTEFGFQETIYGAKHWICVGPLKVPVLVGTRIEEQ